MTGWRSRGRGVGLGALFLLLLALGVEGWRAPSGEFDCEWKFRV